MGAIPPAAILSRKGIARYGGVSRTGPLSSCCEEDTQNSLQAEHAIKTFRIAHHNFIPGEFMCEMIAHLTSQEYFTKLFVAALVLFSQILLGPFCSQERPSLSELIP